MIKWSPAKLKLTLSIGTLCNAALISELFQNIIPAWLAVGIGMFPFAVFVFADPDDLPRSIARLLRVGASLWYLAVNSVLVVLFLFSGLKVGWYIIFIGLAIGAIPCLIVLGRAVIPEPTEEEKRFLNPERDNGLPLEVHKWCVTPNKGRHEQCINQMKRPLTTYRKWPFNWRRRGSNPRPATFPCRRLRT
jgi:hypothetical protein